MLRTALGLALAASHALAQSPLPKLLDFNRHAWVSYSGDHAVAGRWGVHFDGQWRRSDLGLKWQQYQLRPGLNYSPSDRILLTLGYVFTKSYPYGDFPVRDAFPEHRIYQQAVIRQPWGSVRLQHRIRMEQRFVRYPTPQPEVYTYQNRFRYLLKAEIPLKRRPDGQPSWYVPVFDEILIGLPPNYGSRPFDQNRIFAGIGYAAPGASVEVGYLSQFLGQRNGRIFEMNNTLFVAISSNARLDGLWRR